MHGHVHACTMVALNCLQALSIMAAFLPSHKFACTLYMYRSLDLEHSLLCVGCISYK